MSAFLHGHIWLLCSLAIALLVGIVVTQSVIRNLEYEARPRRVLAVVLGGVAIIVTVIMQFVNSSERWLWLAASVPTYFAIQHGINTGIFKNPRFFDPSQEPDLSHFTDPRVVAAVRKKIEQERRLYSTPSLALRFLLPGIVLMLAIITVGYTMLRPPVLENYVLDERFEQGAQMGALGAYLYVVIYLGGRTMRGDTTPASLIWSLSTIVAGPVLAGAVQLVIVKVSPTSSDSWPDNAQWNDLLIPFAAGFSLRIVVSFINASIRRLLTDRIVNSRGESLLRIRGITYDIEERLIEEGIEDVAMLADANPSRLHRNMRFDRRQIISWIDEALLIKYLPSAWQSLENDGVSGAIDLVWYVEFYGFDAIRDVAMKIATTTESAAFAKLAERNKLDVAALAEVVLRMYTDGQVLLIWGLYQLEDGPGEGDSNFIPELREGEESHEETVTADTELSTYREKIYSENRNLFLVHSWKRSATPRQVADVTIRLVEHTRATPSTLAVRRVSYFMGQNFGNRIVVSDSVKDEFATRVSAYGPMLCVARVEFVNGAPPVMLYRYIDFDAPTQTQMPEPTPKLPEPIVPPVTTPAPDSGPTG